MTLDEGTADPKPVPTGAELTPLDPTFQQDPHAVLDELRNREPVHHDKPLERWVLTRRKDIEAMLNDRSMAMDPRKAKPGTYIRMISSERSDRENSMLFLDAPDHTRQLKLPGKN